MTQYIMKQGLKRFGQIGVRAIKKEVIHIVTMDTLEPDNPKELSREDCRATMAYLMFLKEKLDGTIKAQGCCDRRMQRNFMKKEETRYPTVMQE